MGDGTEEKIKRLGIVGCLDTNWKVRVGNLLIQKGVHHVTVGFTPR